MNSGKSIEILRVAHNYREQGKKVMLFTSAKDNRYGIEKITSRIGISEEAKATSILMYDDIKKEMPDCVICDEAQFFSKIHVDIFRKVVDELNIPVICYGLRTDFQQKMFDGSKRLFELADKIEEIKTNCWNCNNKAIFNMRIDEGGNAIFDGDQVKIGGNDNYHPVCSKCYKKEYMKQITKNELI
jgi:thymidine kinase